MSLTFKLFVLRFLDPCNQWIVIASLSLIFIAAAKCIWQAVLQYPAEYLFTGCMCCICSDTRVDVILFHLITVAAFNRYR